MPPFRLADGIAAHYGCFAAMFAIHDRDMRGTGKGQFIDLAIYEPIFALLGPQPIISDQLGAIHNRTGNRSVNNAPRNAYRTRDGRWAALSAAAPSIVRRVLSLTGGPEAADDPRFGPGTSIASTWRIVCGWISERDLPEVLAVFEEAGGGDPPVYDIEQIFRDPQFVAHESIATVGDVDLEPVWMQNVFPRLSRTPGSIRFAGQRIDQHRGEILDELPKIPIEVEVGANMPEGSSEEREA